ncbi:FAD-dependent oxidoreductase [bacterium]|nr:FAD-dependent oxidoreductase [bacterium]
MKRASHRILIIGGVAAGPAAAAKAKRLNPDLDITMFEQGEFISYGTCSMPYYVGDVIKHHEDIITFSAEKFEKEKGCTVKTKHRVVDIKPHRHRVVVHNLHYDKMEEYEYDQLLIATGARARVPNKEWLKASNVFTVKHLSDSIAIKKYIAEKNPRRVVIIGGGYIGMEMAEAFSERRLDVTVIHKDSHPMNTLESETQAIVLDEIKRHGVQFIGSSEVQDIVIHSGVARSLKLQHQSVDADLIILALGFEPNTELAKSIKIRCGRFGGILTDSFLRTNVDHIYAAGACTEIKNIISNKPIYLPLGNIANKMGWIAGENMAGGHVEFKGVVRTTAVKVFDLEVASVGLNSAEAEASDFKVVTESINAYSHVRAYPGSKPVFVKLIMDGLTKRLIGANLVGEKGAALRADVLSVAIQNKMTIRQIAEMDLMYTPPFAPVWDPILVAANQALKKLKA